MRPALARVLAAAAWTVLAAGEGAAQGRASPVSAVREQRADSARALRGARQAQARFESLRFRNLPWTDDSGGGGRHCDEIIGRFCVWHDEEEDDWTPPPEKEAVRSGRAELVARLDEAAARIPGDGWVAGQRVRYLVQAGRASDAARAARECRAARWWCRALEGYALHAAGEYGRADSAFTAALEAMPEAERREWTDFGPVLPDGDARDLRRMDPAARAAAVRRLWWLADPLWTLPGNDRKTEHFSRLMVDRFQDRAREVDGIPWGDDLREIYLRFGEPVGWERIRTPHMTAGRPQVVIHHAPHGSEFFPRLEQVRQPAGARVDDWLDDDPRRTRTAYLPRAVRSLDGLPHQAAVFRRGDSVLVVAAFEMEHDSLPPAPELEAGLVLQRDEAAEPRIARTRVSGRRGVVRLGAPQEEAMLSLEALERTSRRAARARYGVDLRRPAAPGLALSDVLLLADSAARPASLDEAAPLARGTTRFAPGERLGLFWEVYGLDPRADTLTLAVALSRRGVGGLRRTAERLGLARAATPVRMRWSEEVEAGAVLPRSLAIALPDVPDGDYVIEVSVRTRAGATASATREIRVEREKAQRKP
ncbi:MAG TPA: hypothetical protein VF746_23200 [Longimicrobium sp.]|jgi:hypothetical protein